ncbi:Hypothetical_protein [Hexamita inflata]|uniref:Hypothetical_protein n=1 Tax=Hexamita inflata TaxID=28002 RepID=A0AA86TNT4_9EUKA|nr:Hypothetical protein HINF_LOCUS10891 [Hexamita inflata]
MILICNLNLYHLQNKHISTVFVVSNNIPEKYFTSNEISIQYTKYGLVNFSVCISPSSFQLCNKLCCVIQVCCKDQYQFIRLRIASTSCFNHIFFLQIVYRKTNTKSYAKQKRVLPREDDVIDQTDPYAIQFDFHN